MEKNERAGLSKGEMEPDSFSTYPRNAITVRFPDHHGGCDLSIGGCFTACPSILSSPSQTGWEGIHRGYPWPCLSFRATESGACYRAEYGCAWKDGRLRLRHGLSPSSCLKNKKAVKSNPGGKTSSCLRMTLPHSGSESDLTAFAFALVSTPS
jgi:hypothetical protein